MMRNIALAAVGLVGLFAVSAMAKDAVVIADYTGDTATSNWSARKDANGIPTGGSVMNEKGIVTWKVDSGKLNLNYFKAGKKGAKVDTKTGTPDYTYSGITVDSSNSAYVMGVTGTSVVVAIMTPDTTKATINVWKLGKKAPTKSANKTPLSITGWDYRHSEMVKSTLLISTDKHTKLTTYSVPALKPGKVVKADVAGMSYPTDIGLAAKYFTADTETNIGWEIKLYK